MEVIGFTISSPDISIFRLANDDTKVETIPFPFISYVIWIVFGIVMSVLFLNFLVCTNIYSRLLVVLLLLLLFCIHYFLFDCYVYHCHIKCHGINEIEAKTERQTDKQIG